MPIKKTKQYQYNPHKHVKIWLSNKPDVFLNAENKMRLIDMRYTNPNDEINLIYDSSLLNDGAIQQLYKFCRNYAITPINANDFKSSLKTDKEFALFSFYKDEITHLKEGGNLALASDIIRWLPHVYLHGTYTDFDVPVDTNHLPATVNVNSPLLLNIGSLRVGKKEVVLSNNDYIAVVDPVAAKDEIERIQNGFIRILSEYTNDFVERTEQDFGKDSYLNRFLLKFMRQRSESIYIAKSKTAFTTECPRTSRELRHYINELMTDQYKFLDFNKSTPVETHDLVIKRLRENLANQMGIIKWLFFRSEYNEIKKMLAQPDEQFLSYLMKKERSMYVKSIVVCTTGPIAVAKSLFGGYVFSTQYFTENLQSYSFNNYGLQHSFRSKNSIPMHEHIWGMMRFLGAGEGELNDSSWLETGAQLQKIREEELAIRRNKLKSSLHGTIADIKHNMELHFNKIEEDMSGLFRFYRSASKKGKRDALNKILACFKEPQNEFNLIEFRHVLKEVYANQEDVFDGLFYSHTQDLIEQLERTCHEAQVLGLTKNHKISLNCSHSSFPVSSVKKNSYSQSPDIINEVLYTFGLNFFKSNHEVKTQLTPLHDSSKSLRV